MNLQCPQRYRLTRPKRRQAKSQRKPPGGTISPLGARQKQNHCMTVAAWRNHPCPQALRDPSGLCLAAIV